MAEAFPRTLTLLRKERGLSQKSAAEALHVSQALLSHYENGAREPSYDFLIRASVFYHVTTDYLLGLTMSRERSEDILLGDPEHEVFPSPQKLNLLKNSLSLLYDLLEGLGIDTLTERLEKYLTLAIYKMFRYLYLSYPGVKDELFSVPYQIFSELVTIEMRRTELEIRMQSGKLSEEKPEGEVMSYDLLAEKYPEHSRYTMQLLFDAGEYLIPENERLHSVK